MVILILSKIPYGKKGAKNYQTNLALDDKFVFVHVLSGHNALSTKSSKKFSCKKKQKYMNILVFQLKPTLEDFMAYSALVST